MKVRYKIKSPSKFFGEPLEFSMNELMSPEDAAAYQEDGVDDLDWELYTNNGQLWLHYKGDHGETGSINVAKLLRSLNALYPNTFDVLATVPRTEAEVTRELLIEHLLAFQMGVPSED